MSNRSLRIFLIFSAVVLSSIIIMQGYWLHTAWKMHNSDFERRVLASLRVVNTRINDFYKLNNNSANPVRKVTENYFVVDMPANIDAAILEAYLKREFKRNDVNVDFEYGVYDCSVNNIRYGGYVCNSDNCDNIQSVHYHFPGINENSYYFGVYFPSVALAGGTMTGWILSSAALLLLIFIFCCAIYIVLRQKRLSEIQKDFVNNITHEFNTPVATISISAEALLTGQVKNQPERIHQYATIIKQETERLKEHTSRILQAGLVSGHARLNLKPVEVNNVIRLLIENMGPLLRSKNVSVRLSLCTENPLLKTDDFHFTNVLYNLVDNAIKYGSENPVIEIGTAVNKKHVTISVSDNGPGIEKSEQKKIFKRFYRVPNGNVHNVRGFGLGLYYVSIIVKRLKGEIKLFSQPGRGSNFSLVFNL